MDTPEEIPPTLYPATKNKRTSFLVTLKIFTSCASQRNVRAYVELRQYWTVAGNGSYTSRPESLFLDLIKSNTVKSWKKTYTWYHSGMNTTLRDVACGRTACNPSNLLRSQNHLLAAVCKSEIVAESDFCVWDFSHNSSTKATFKWGRIKLNNSFLPKI